MLKRNLGEFPLSGSIFVHYQDGLRGVALVSVDGGIVPLELSSDELSFISSRPLLMEKLKQGKQLYLRYFSGYLGEEKTRGAYCEEQIFAVEYESSQFSPFELVHLLDKNVQQGKRVEKELIKIGNHYCEESLGLRN